MSRNLPMKALTAAAVIASLLLLGGCKSTAEPEAPPQAEARTSVQAEKKTRDGIQTMLVMGLMEYDSETGGAFRSGARSDLLLLIVMDEGKQTAKMLQINPDTVVSFTPQGGSPEEIPLGLVISYGSGGSDSCLSQRKSVSKLLGGVPVDHYMTVTPESIGVVSDMLGGIPVTPTESFRQRYPEACDGEEVTLQGEMAKTFFFSREDGDVKNEDHMERQRRFLTRLFTPFMAKAQDDDFLMKLTMELGEGFTTDLTLSQMVTLLQDLGEYKLEEEILTIPGTVALADGVPRFQVEEQGLNQLMDELFF